MVAIPPEPPWSSIGMSGSFRSSSSMAESDFPISDHLGETRAANDPGSAHEAIAKPSHTANALNHFPMRGEDRLSTSFRPV
jgi:hypothetical protein